MVRNLAQELRRKGHEVHVFTNPMVYRAIRGNRQGASDELRDDERFVHEFLTKSQYSRVGSSHMLGLWGRAGQKLEELASNVKPDVVHWHNTRAFIGVPIEVRRAVNLYTAHDYTLVCPKGSLLRHDVRLCETPELCQICLLRSRKSPQIWRVGTRRRTLRPAPGIQVLTPSEFMAGKLEAESIHVSEVLRNFVPDPGPGNNKPEDNRRLVYLGILEPHKGPQTLLEAFSMCRDAQGFNLVMIGRGLLENRLRAEVQERKLRDRVQIRGFIPRDEITELLNGSAAMIIPSEWYENAPLAALEALAMGVPLIASDIGGLPEIVRNVKGSMSFRPGDAVSLAERLVTFWDNSDTLNEKSSAAREAYVSRYTPDTHIKNYLEALSHSNDCRGAGSDTAQNPGYDCANFPHPLPP